MRLISDIINDYKKIQEEFELTRDVEAVKGCVNGYQALLNEVCDEPTILFQLGTAHLQLGQYGAAAVYFDRSLDFMPDNPHAWSNLGCCYRQLHLVAKARVAFLKAIMFEEAASNYSNMASTFCNEDTPGEGIPFAEKAIELAPDLSKPKWNASLLYLEIGDWEKGFTMYDAGFFCGERQMRAYTNNNPDTVPWWDGMVNRGAGDEIQASPPDVLGP